MLLPIPRFFSCFLGLIFLFATAAAADEWTVYNSANSEFPGSLARHVEIASDGVAWIASDAGLVSFAAGQWTVWNTANSQIPSDDVRDVHVFHETVWAGTAKGLFALNTIDNEQRVWTTANSDLPHNFVRSLAQARDGGVWLATSAGLARFGPDGWTVFNSANSGLPADNVQTVERVSDNVVWCGTEGGGVARYDQGEWLVLNESNSSLPSNIVFALHPVSADEVYIGAWGAGLAHYNNGSWALFNSQNSGLAHNWINDIALNNCGGLWLGTRAAGISMLYSDVWETLAPQAGGLPDGQVFGLTIDKQRRVWVAFNGGVALLDPDERVLVGRPERFDFCAGGGFTLPLGTRGEFDPQNSFFVQLSDPSGDFANLMQLNSLPGSCAAAVTVQLPEGLTPSNLYRLRVVSSLPVSINELPESITIKSEPQFNIDGGALLCVGETLTLSVEGGFSSYLWNTGENTPSIEIDAAGEYSVTVMENNGCSGTRSIVVTEAQPPQLTMPGDSVLCRNGELELTAQAGAAQVFWSPAAAFESPVGAQVRVVLSESAMLYATATSSEGCSVRDSVFVQVVDPPEQPRIEVRNDSLIGIRDSEVMTALWLLNDELYADARQTPNIKPNEDGVYVLTVADEFGCAATSEPFTWPPVIDDVKPEDAFPSLSFGPNPFNASLRFSMPGGPLRDLDVELRDLPGRVALRGHWRAGAPDFELGAARLAAGVYVLTIRGQGAPASRLVVKR